MAIPVQITFRDVPRSEALERRVHDHFAKIGR